MVQIGTDQSEQNVARVAMAVADFFKKYRDEWKRAQKYFPKMEDPAYFIVQVLRDGMDEIETKCDWEEENERLAEMDNFREVDIYICDGDVRVNCEKADEEGDACPTSAGV